MPLPTGSAFVLRVNWEGRPLFWKRDRGTAEFTEGVAEFRADATVPRTYGTGSVGLVHFRFGPMLVHHTVVAKVVPAVA